MTRKIRVPIVSIGDCTELWWVEGETPETALLAETQKIVGSNQTLTVPKDEYVHDINRQVIEDDVQQAMQEVEIPDGAELKYAWQDGVATVKGKDGNIKRYAIVVVRLK